MGWIVFCSNFLVLFVFTNIVFFLNWRPPKGVSLHCDHLERAELNMEFMVLDDILPWIDNHYMSQYTRFLSGPLQVRREHCSTQPTTSAVFQCANCTRWEWQGTRTCSTNESLDLLTWLSPFNISSVSFPLLIQLFMPWRRLRGLPGEFFCLRTKVLVSGGWKPHQDRWKFIEWKYIYHPWEPLAQATNWSTFYLEHSCTWNKI